MSTEGTPPHVRFHAPALPDVDAYLEDVRAIVESGWLSDATFVRRLEHEIAPWAGVDRTVAVSNCSDGLIAALSVLAEPACEVIIPAFTYLATWSAVLWAGMTPVVADVDDRALLDPEAVSAALTPRTGAIVVVHMAGQPAAMEALRSIADARGIPLIADAAHALGARTTGGPVGRDGDAEVFSIGATKQLAAAEGGIIAARDPQVLDRLRLFALQGHHQGELDALARGMNLRLTELNAALGLRLLERYEAQLARREDVHRRYAEAFATLPLRLSGAHPGERCAHKDQLVWTEDPADRDRLRAGLAEDGIETRPYYHVAVPDLRVFEGRVASAERARRLASRSLAIPIHARLTDAEVDRVIASVCRSLGA